MPNSEESAFPCSIVDHEMVVHVQPGLTKRELFAMVAMQGYVAHNGNHFTQEITALWSVKLADAVLAELAKPIS